MKEQIKVNQQRKSNHSEKIVRQRAILQKRGMGKGRRGKK